MHTSSRIIELPTEILLAIFQNLTVCNHQTKKKNGKCICWCLDIMSAATVCKSWYSILFKTIIPSDETYYKSNYRENLFTPWPEMMINDMGFERTYPHLERMIDILKESRKYNLDLHRQLRYIVIDFVMLEKIDPQNVHGKKSYIENIIQLFTICSNIERLGIMFDTKFVSQVSQGTALSENIQQLSSFVHRQKKANCNNNKIKQLDLIGYNPIQRCPCCAGKDWDHLLIPLIDALSLKEVVFRHVVPTTSLCEAFTRQNSLIKLTLFRSIMTIPSNDKEQLPVDQRPTSIERIPDRVWKQIKQLEILEDSEDSSIWPTRYLDKISQRIGTLEQFSLVFGTTEENMQYLENKGEMETSLNKGTVIPENNRFGTALNGLILACSKSITQMLLANVPNIESGHVWFD